MKQVLMLVAVFGIALAASPLSAYEEVPVMDGGTIIGKVLMKGEEPPPKAYNLVLFPEPAYCAAEFQPARAGVCWTSSRWLQTGGYRMRS